MATAKFRAVSYPQLEDTGYVINVATGAQVSGVMSFEEAEALAEQYNNDNIEEDIEDDLDAILMNVYLEEREAMMDDCEDYTEDENEE